MNFCFYSPPQSQLPRALRSFSRHWPAKIFIFGKICAIALGFAAISLSASNSQFPDFLPSAPTGTVANSAKPPAYTMGASPVLAKPAETNGAAHPFTEPTDTNTASDAATNPMEALDNEYRLATGDTISFQITEDKADPDNSGDALAIVVGDSGDVEIPYIGPYPAVGKTCQELARQLKTELEKKYYYQATVIISVKSMTSKGVVYVMGGVRTPGPMELPRDEVLTVSKAILRAGGFDDFADQKHVQVTRKEGGTNAVFTVNVSAILDRSKIDEDRDAQPGDFIYVPEKTFRY